MKYRFLFFILVTQLVFCQEVKQLKTGDLLFQSMNCGPLCEAINEVTEGYQGHDFSHMGLIYIKNDSIFVLEASGKAVKMTPLDVFSNYTDSPMFVGRVKRKYRKYIPNAIAFTLSQIGMPYDDAYLYNNGSYYCSELIFDAFLNAYGASFFELQPMTFKSPETNSFFPVWVEYYAQLKMEIPEGKLGCNPGGISTSDKLTIIGTIK